MIEQKLNNTLHALYNSGLSETMVPKLENMIIDVHVASGRISRDAGKKLLGRWVRPAVREKLSPAELIKHFNKSGLSAGEIMAICHHLQFVSSVSIFLKKSGGACTTTLN